MNDKFFDLKREKQDRIINAGLKIFARYGYRHATTDEIVKEAGISKGLLFHYFTNKVGIYVFLMDYSVRYLLLELSRSVKETETDFFEICKQIEEGNANVLRVYPYMKVFLDKAFDELCPEALQECEGQKEIYKEKMEKYYEQCKDYSFKNKGSFEKMKKMITYLEKGIMSRNMAADTMQAEMMKEEYFEYIELLKGVF